MMDGFSVALSSPRRRNPEFREPESTRMGNRGPWDHHGDFQGAGVSKFSQSRPWHLLAQQDSLSREQ